MNLRSVFTDAYMLVSVINILLKLVITFENYLTLTLLPFLLPSPLLLVYYYQLIIINHYQLQNLLSVPYLDKDKRCHDKTWSRRDAKPESMCTDVTIWFTSFHCKHRNTLHYMLLRIVLCCSNLLFL